MHAELRLRATRLTVTPNVPVTNGVTSASHLNPQPILVTPFVTGTSGVMNNLRHPQPSGVTHFVTGRLCVTKESIFGHMIELALEGSTIE